MKKSILIVTTYQDLHAHAVARVLRREGAEVYLWHTTDFPSKGEETIRFDGKNDQIHLRGPGFELSGLSVDTVWNRRRSLVLDQEILHDADRKFALRECISFRDSLFDMLSPDSFWVNPWNAGQRAERKPVQYSAAAEVGLQLPNTLFGNSPERIREFIDEHDGRIVYKALQARPWTDGERTWMPYTSTLSKSDLPDDDILRATPGIFQEVVQKDHELRVTIMGNRVFSAKILSQETAKGRLDWRQSYGELKMTPHTLDPEVAQTCLDFMERLGIVFGCFDFVVTPEGRHVFLEVNQMGQFLFVELYTELPLLDAFTHFLLQGQVDFEWKADEVEVHFTEEFEESVQSEMERVKDRHIPLPDTTWTE